jgi:Abnormal spindle-like microcephaly-assoc'd, ASPM-SPD-2-Hydin
MRRALTFPLFLAVLLVLTCIGFSLSSSLVSNAAETARTESERTNERATAKKAPSTAKTEPKAGPKRRQKPEQASKPLTKSLSIGSKGINVRFPESWSEAPREYANAYELRNVSADRLGSSEMWKAARILIFASTGRDHADALRMLKEIALEEYSPSTFLSIGGWPALQRRHLQPVDRVSDAKPQAGDEEMSLRLTTAIAAGNQLIRLQAYLPPGTPSEVADEVEAIGRSASFPTVASPTQLDRELNELRRGPASTPRLDNGTNPDSSRPESSSSAQSLSSPDDALSLNRTINFGVGELEVAVSNSGRSIVVGTNSGWVNSQDGGQMFNPSTGTLVNSDPSLAIGRSGDFYAAFISKPAGACATGISRSMNGGQNFVARTNAAFCPATGSPMCFPDQEHIAADRFNADAAGGDRLYSVWRDFSGSTNCPNSGSEVPSIVCSNDSGATWSTKVAVPGCSDRPRVTVGQDSFVYAVCRGGSNTIRVQKYNPCATGMTPSVSTVGGFVTVATVNDVNAVAGFDRSANLGSQMVAVDDTNPNHVYVAYATSTSGTNDDVIIQDSTDGGMTFPPARTLRLNQSVPGRRLMPWVCSVGGAAQVSWYDQRRGAGGTDSSLTDFFCGTAALDGSGNLAKVGTESQVNTGTDSTCRTETNRGWSCSVDAVPESELCSMQFQPALAGVCVDGAGNNTGSCDLSDCGTTSCGSPMNGGGACQCAAGSTCQCQGGCPVYGDYNGNACGAGRVYFAWASGVSPVGTPGGIRVLFDQRLVCCVGQIQVPGSVTFPDTCVGSTSTSTLNVCNTGKADLNVNSIASNNTQFGVTTPSSGFPVTISPDFCFPFQVRFTPTSTGAQTATLTVNSDDPVNPAVTVQASGNGVQQRLSTVIADSGNFGDVCVGSFKDLALTISNSGGCDLLISNITSSSSQFLVASTMTFPVVIGPGDNLQVPIRFQPTSLGAKTGTITISSNDPTTPKLVAVSGNAPPGDIRVTGSTSFGDVCAGVVAEKTISVCNVGACNLHVTSATLNCPDFTLVNNPFPATVSPDSCLNLVIRFTPTSPGPKSCILTITSDDPDTPVINLPVMANTPAASIDVPPDQSFPPEVIQSVGACSTLQPFPISNTGTCNLTITNITIGGTNASDFGVSGLPSFPIILEPGHTVGDGDLMTLFAPTEIDRDRLGTLTVTYVSNPINGATTTVTRSLCGEGVRTGARVLVTNAGVPVPFVEKIQIQRINGNRNKDIVDTVDNAMNLPLVSVTPSLPCMPFQYHREYGTVSNPIQLLPGSYQVTASAIINGKRKSLTVAFNVDTCDFNQTIVVNFP